MSGRDGTFSPRANQARPRSRGPRQVASRSTVDQARRRGPRPRRAPSGRAPREYSARGLRAHDQPPEVILRDGQSPTTVRSTSHGYIGSARRRGRRKAFSADDDRHRCRVRMEFNPRRAGSSATGQLPRHSGPRSCTISARLRYRWPRGHHRLGVLVSDRSVESRAYALSSSSSALSCSSARPRGLRRHGHRETPPATLTSSHESNKLSAIRTQHRTRYRIFTPPASTTRVGIEFIAADGGRGHPTAIRAQRTRPHDRRRAAGARSLRASRADLRPSRR